MSEEKRLKARVVHKHKTYAEWYLDVYDESGKLRSDPFIPLDGELIIFDPDENCTHRRKKYGDGVSNVMELPFAEEIYIGDGDMPENATIQIILDGEEESGESIDSAISEHNVDTTAHTDIRAQINKLSSNKVDKLGISLGVASDGLIYVFIDGMPVGTGIPQGQSGDVTGYVDENNTIVLNGALADGTYSIKYEMENGDTVNIGNLVLDTNVYYSVTKNLSYCSINNSATSVIEGEPYSATISANDGYELKSITVTMGGANVSVTNGVINIASVTGNIVITAVAEEVVVEPEEDNLFNKDTALLNHRLSSGGSPSAYDGMVTTDFIPIDSSMSNKQFRINGITLVRSSAYGYCKRTVYYDANKTKIYEDNATVAEGETIATYTYNVSPILSAMTNFTSGYLRVAMVIKDKVALTSDDIANLTITLEDAI